MGSEIPRGAFAWLIKLYKRQELLQTSEWLTKPPRIDTGNQQYCLGTRHVSFIQDGVTCGTAFPIITSSAVIPRFR
jgi:hypothetical protein